VNGAEVAIEALRREGVRHIVGLPGTTIMHLIDAAGRSPGVRYLSVRHEQVAAFMADGYARAAGSIGVCTASRGPGAANLATGVHNAHAESIPVLALIGQVPDEIYYREAFEEMDLVRFFGPITKWSVEIHQPSRIAELMQRAVRTALSGRPGPVMVSLPLDVQTAEAAARYQATARPIPPAAPAAAVEAALARLASAQRPVIIAGGGVRGPGYSAGLLKLAERLAIPVVTTWLRKNAFPNDSPLFCGSLGYGALAVTEDVVREADLVLAAGCRFSEFTTGRWTLLSPGTALIQIDIDPDGLGRTYVPDVGICADVSQAAQALADAAEEAGAGPPPGRLGGGGPCGLPAAGPPAEASAGRGTGVVSRTGRGAAHRARGHQGHAGAGRAEPGPVDPALPRLRGARQLLRLRRGEHGLGLPGRHGHAARPAGRAVHHCQRGWQLLDGRPGPGDGGPGEAAGRHCH